MSNGRKLKIHSKFRRRRWDNIIIPEIRLEGEWLRKLGFNEGKHVKIEEKRNKIIITLNKEDNEKRA